MNILQEDFTKLVNFVQHNFGIDLSRKKQLIESRLSNTLKEKGYSDFSSYVKYITTTKNKNDIDLMLNKLTTNYTYFMREREHFDFFKDTILPYLAETKKTSKILSIWSAGCSSGEEPYTLTMLLKDYFSKQPGWDTRILATDISQNVLSTAMKGEYAIESIKEVPPHWKTSYFSKTANPSKVCVTKAVKDNVIFRTFNLMDPINFKMKFDVIFCRNVMIYFDQPTKDALVNRFYNATNPGGYLLIGHSESVNRAAVPYKYIMPATYRK